MTIKPNQLILPATFDLSAFGLGQRKSFQVGRDCKSIELRDGGTAVVDIPGKGIIHVLPSGAVAVEDEKAAKK